MDGHELRSIHDPRCFFNKNIEIDKITGQLKATPVVWKAWFYKANAFRQVDPSRSYASVARQSTFSNVHSQVEVPVIGHEEKNGKNM